MKSRNERYHDRIAARYDDVYGSAFWRFYREVSWRHAQRFLPDARPARAADIGCGTGHFGIRLLKAGFAVDFVDLSQNMLEQKAKEHAKAAAHYEKAIKLRPDFAEAHLNLAAALQAMSQQDEAVVSFEKALELKPQLAKGYFSLKAKRPSRAN